MMVEMSKIQKKFLIPSGDFYLNYGKLLVIV